MGQKVNLLLLVVIAASIGNIAGIVGFPFAILLTLVLSLLIHFRDNLIIIYKTLPRDVKGILILYSVHKKLKEYEKRDLTLHQLFRQQYEKTPKNVSIYFEDEKWTYEDVENFSNKIANSFKSAGYQKGDVVALLMGNCPEYFGIWLGLSKIGVITALVNHNLKSDSLLHCIKVADAKGVIFNDQYIPEIEEVSDSLNGIEIYQYPCNNQSNSLKTKNLHDLVRDASALVPEPNDKIGFRDRVVYIYTSGTTGLPKPAIFVHHRLLLMSFIRELINLEPGEIVYNPLPLYHTAGGIIGIAGPICYGNSVVIKKKFSASAFWPDCIKYNCTAAQYIGEMCRYIQMVPPRPVDAEHKVRVLFGNGMRPKIMETFRERFHVERIVELYGSTEGNTNTMNIDNKVGAVGFLPKIIPAFVLPIALIRVNESGVPLRDRNGFCIRCKAHEPGMLIGTINRKNAIREYQGYVGKEKENQKKIVENVFKKGDRAFLSGDILVMDELGYLYFKDRTGDTFRWKGENVSTLEVEETIAAVIGLKEVTVYGVEVSNLEGRAGMAAIVDPNGEVDLGKLFTELKRKLPSYAQPLFIRLTKEPSITGTFKLKKIDLQREGFNPSVITDKIYFSNGGQYVELTKNLYDLIINGECRI